MEGALRWSRPIGWWAPGCCGWALFAALWLWVTPALAKDVPSLRGRVTDEAGVLSAAQARRIEQRLMDYEQATGRQFSVLTVPSLEGDPIEDFSIRVVEAWKLGHKGEDDGLLLLLAVEDRTVRIEVGYGLEGEVTDLVSARIIHDVMRPYLRSDRYGEALSAGVEALIAVAGPTTAPPEQPPQSWWTRTFAGHTVLWYGLMAVVAALGPSERTRTISVPPSGPSEENPDHLEYGSFSEYGEESISQGNTRTLRGDDRDEKSEPKLDSRRA